MTKANNEASQGIIRLDPIIAVRDVKASADWYCNIFGFNNAHGGSHFAVLTNDAGEVVLCLHAWEMHDHPTMQDQSVPAGNGLLLYFRMENWKTVQQNLERMVWKIEQPVHENPNSRKQEFSFRDPDGYFITVTEFHNYKG
jgi:catechol 2,3-dioxygenase-like lactoylglutathione lyase family enzyme